MITPDEYVQSLEALDSAASDVSAKFDYAHTLANESSGPNDDRAIVLAIEALASAVIAVGRAVIIDRHE